MTRIGIISAYPDEDWDARQIAQAAAQLGDVQLLAPTDFGAVMEEGRTLITVRGEDARAYDLLLTPRALGDAGDAEFQFELYYALAESGAVLVNDVRALITAIDKFKSSWLFVRAGLPTPRVVVAQRLEEACQALAEMRCAVVKPLYGSLGIGVERITVDDAGRLGELLERHRALYLQRYVENSRYDVRAFVVGDRVEAAIARRAQPGEFRANIHQGAAFEEHELDEECCELAVRATRATGLDYSGVDLLITDEGPCVLEVNGTPSFRAVNQATGRDMAMAIVQHAVARAEGGAASGTPRWGSRRQARRRDYARPLRARVLRGKENTNGE